jgi:hypothetical protein
MKRVTVTPGSVQITCTGGSKVSNIRVGDDWIVRPQAWHVRLLGAIKRFLFYPIW